jgi:hypothetical protein
VGSCTAFRGAKTAAFQVEGFVDDVTGRAYLIETNIETGTRRKFVQPSSVFATELLPAPSKKLN